MQATTLKIAQSERTTKLIRNTYTLLAITLAFSAVMAAVGVAIGIGSIASIVCTIGAIAIMWFVLPRTANSSMGLVTVFAFTGLLGLGLGPMLTYYLGMPNGGQLVMLAMGGTAAIFLGLSGYALTSKTDFSFLGGFIGAGMLVVILAMLVGIFADIPGLQLAISAAVVLLMCGFLLYETSQMVNGHVDNYIIMTASLYLSIYNIFVNLLALLGFASND